MKSMNGTAQPMERNARGSALGSLHKLAAVTQIDRKSVV